ncbi:cytochrome P450 3A2-like [Ornithodoros turicata]|uniref:cytochrome P450 3A2-like n=1 Tax=Ornithodoros turicata TaxID=34597 RepID=UPI003139C6F7
MILEPLFILIWVLGLTALVRWRRKKLSVFKEMGLDGPTPNLIWGNLLEYDGKKRVPALTEWAKKYGDIFGFYNGDIPTLVVKDLQVQQRIFISDFTDYTYRGSTMRTDEQHPYLGTSLLHARGIQWKKNRVCTSQGMTTYKFKQMWPHFQSVADEFLKILSQKADTEEEVNMEKPFQALAMDYAGQAAFGVHHSFQNDIENPFLKAAAEAVPGVMKGIFHKIAHCTTTLSAVMTPLLWLHSKLGTFTFGVFSKSVYQVVDQRKKVNLKRIDLLQSMLDAEVSKEHSGEFNNNDVKKDPKKISADDVAVNATVLFVAAFGTTSTALSYLTYVMAKYPEVQEKMREEVEAALKKSDELDYNTVMGLTYVNQVMQETLRMYPPVIIFTTREAEVDKEVNGLKIPAGTTIMAPTYQVHMDEKHWPEPEKFDPERFSPENMRTQHPLAYQPFGIGPRNCVGMRLAILEILYTAARMVLEYEVQLGEKQQGEMHLDYDAMVSKPEKGPWIKFYRRKTNDAVPS